MINEAINSAISNINSIITRTVEGRHRQTTDLAHKLLRKAGDSISKQNTRAARPKLDVSLGQTATLTKKNLPIYPDNILLGKQWAGLPRAPQSAALESCQHNRMLLPDWLRQGLPKDKNQRFTIMTNLFSSEHHRSTIPPPPAVTNYLPHLARNEREYTTSHIFIQQRNKTTI